MNRNQAKELLPIIQAYAEGQSIEISSITDVSKAWREVTDFPLGMINSFKFRIKPVPKYRPFKDAEECWKEMQKHQPFGWLECVGCRYNIVSVSNIDVSMADVSGDIVTLRFCEVMESDTFADGTPFGVKEEE